MDSRPTSIPRSPKPRRATLEGDQLVAPCSLWPRERCNELNGEGWLVEVLRVRDEVALVKFQHARNAEGRPYSAILVKWQELRRSPELM